MNDRSHRNRILAGSVGLLALLGVVALIVGRPSANRPTLTQTAISAADANRAASETASAPPTVHYLWPTFTPTRTPSWQPSSTPTGPTRTPGPTETPGPYPADNRIWYQDESVTVYTRDNHLCLLRGDQPPVYLSDAGGIGEFHANLMLSPDGTMVAFVKEMPLGDWTHYDELWVVNVDGTNPRRLFVTKENVPALMEYVQYPQIIDLDWIPYSHLLALTTADISGPGTLYNKDLYLADADQGTYQILLAPGDGGYELYPSPDGKQIAVVTPRSIGLINADGSNWQRDVFTYPAIICHCGNEVFVHPVWKPDSSGLLVAVPPPESDPQFTDEVPVMTTWFIPANGRQPVKLATFDNMRIAGPNNAIFSPDGQYIAYVSVVPDESRYRVSEVLHIMRADGSDDTVYYASSSVSFEYWEADSRHFVFWIGQNLFRRGEIGGIHEPLPTPEVPEQGCAPGS